jgi:hypothetical protein
VRKGSRRVQTYFSAAFGSARTSRQICMRLWSCSDEGFLSCYHLVLVLYSVGVARGHACALRAFRALSLVQGVVSAMREVLKVVCMYAMRVKEINFLCIRS